MTDPHWRARLPFVDSYLNYLSIERRLTQRTIDRHGRLLRRFFEFAPYASLEHLSPGDSVPFPLDRALAPTVTAFYRFLILDGKLPCR